MTLSLLLSALTLGLFGAGHCATMCGPVTIALISREPQRPRQPWLTHFGRISMYAALGAAMAASSAQVTQWLRNTGLQTAWLILPNLLLLFSALYLMGVQTAYAPVEKFGRGIWSRLGGVRNWALAQPGPLGAYVRGAIWGLLPCGLIYSALGLAVLAADALSGALVMAAFGASTLPVLLAIGLLSQQTVKRLQTLTARRWMGGALLLMVAWNLYLLPDRLKGVRFSFFC